MFQTVQRAKNTKKGFYGGFYKCFCLDKVSLLIVQYFRIPFSFLVSHYGKYRGFYDVVNLKCAEIKNSERRL